MLRVRFVCRYGVSRGAKRLHRIESSKMLFIFSPFDGRLCALAQGWGAHLSVIFLPCLPLRAGGRASMRFPRQFRGPYGLKLSILSLSLSIYLFIYLSRYIYLYYFLSIYLSIFYLYLPSLDLLIWLSLSPCLCMTGFH